MLFGQSVFQSVLERLREEQAESVETDEDGGTDIHRVRGLSTGFVVGNSMYGTPLESRRLDDLYHDYDPDPIVQEPEKPPVMPAHLARTAPEDVSAEIALSEHDTISTLNEKRRSFAKLNHPDGVNAAFRDNATIRMTIANLLIDEAIRRLGWQAPSA